MPAKVLQKNIALPPYNEREILRYAGVRGEGDENTRSLLLECLNLCEGVFTPRVCYCVLSREDLFSAIPDAGKSEGLNGALSTAKTAVVFAATVGLGVDRLIRRYASVAPSKGLTLQAIGAERMESLCNEFCRQIRLEYGETGKRFSAGYGDFPLSAQRDIFRLLDCPKRIGLTLTEGLMMAPTKSVTAIFGLGIENCERECGGCEKADCGYRK